ncbi:MAG: hypothetical protein FJ255_06180 [Phycisphaerae bacterium]|nr:hypothetical protein [Phycisphaerae bacterium]
MQCLAVLLALCFPRLTIVLLVIFSDYIGRGFNDSVLWPLLGFLFMPFTTLAYAASMNENGAVEGWWLVLVIVAVLADLGLIGGGAAARRKQMTTG